jgi:hypothetical protein
MPGERFSKLYDQNDPESKLLDHKVCDSEKNFWRYSDLNK